MKFELWKIKNESYVIKVFAIQKKRPFTAVVKKWRKTFRNEICKIWFWFCIILYHAQLLIHHVHLYLKVGVTLNVNLPMDAISTICHFNANFIFISIIFDVLILSFLNPRNRGAYQHLSLRDVSVVLLAPMFGLELIS